MPICGYILSRTVYGGVLLHDYWVMLCKLRLVIQWTFEVIGRDSTGVRVVENTNPLEPKLFEFLLKLWVDLQLSGL